MRRSGLHRPGRRSGPRRLGGYRLGVPRRRGGAGSLVRPRGEYLDAFAGLEAWLTLAQSTHDQVVDHLEGLPTAFRDDDSSEEAKRFDLLGLRLQLALVRADTGYDRLCAQATGDRLGVAGPVHDSGGVAQQELIDELVGDEWCQDVTLPFHCGCPVSGPNP